MKIKVIITSLILIIVIFHNITLFAEENHSVKCIDKEGYELYTCQKSNVCLKQEYWQNTKKVTQLDKFWKENIDYDKVKDLFVVTKWEENKVSNIKKAKYLYRKNQNNIYRCWIINSQISIFDSIKKTLNSTDKSGKIKEKILKKIGIKKEKLEAIAEKECSIIDSSKKQMKKIILDQSTLELCNYMYYLDYLDYKVYNDLGDSFPEDRKSISAIESSEILSEKKNEIEKEKINSFKLYTLAFDSYKQYESFLKLHVILELLKEDYRILRDKLYLNLHPINQVVYKIINAQSR